jgi:hypothetical protein
LGQTWFWKSYNYIAIVTIGKKQKTFFVEQLCVSFLDMWETVENCALSTGAFDFLNPNSEIDFSKIEFVNLDSKRFWLVLELRESFASKRQDMFACS